MSLSDTRIWKLGAKGFIRSGITKHLMGQHSGDLVRTSPNFALVSKLVESLDRKVFIVCSRIMMCYMAKEFCRKCDKKQTPPSIIVSYITES